MEHQPQDCKPTVLDPVTMTPMPEDSPAFQAVLEYWKTTTPEDRAGFHEFCCHNSRDPKHVQIMDRMTRGIEAAMRQKHDQSFAT
jgi:hypothetical protein